MIRKILSILFVLGFTFPAFAKSKKTVTKPAPVAAPQEQSDSSDQTLVTRKDQFETHVMKGFNVALALATINVDMQITPNSGSSFHANTNNGATMAGVSVNYADLQRGQFGWSAGGTIISKVENDTSASSSLSSVHSFTQIRPEGNLAYAFNNGIWGMFGGHLSGMFGGGIEEAINPLGLGGQIVLGYTPVKNMGFDLGYYLTIHRISDKMADNGNLKKDESSYIFNQIQARATYYF